MTNLSTSALKKIKSFLEATLDVSIPVASFNSFLVTWFGKSITPLTLSAIGLFGSE